MEGKISTGRLIGNIVSGICYGLSFIFLFLPGVLQVLGWTLFHWILILVTVIVLVKTTIQHKKLSRTYFLFYGGLVAWIICAALWINERTPFIDRLSEMFPFLN